MEALGRLASGVAHDLANILTLISGYSDILWERTGESDPQRAELYEIRAAAKRGARLTTQLLDYARGQAAQPRAIDLNPLIAGMERSLLTVLGESVELQIIAGPNLGRVMADPGQVEQVIMNLVRNARDAMPAGGRIRIETSAGESGEDAARAHGMVLLSICDSGGGIDPAVLERVFQPFFTTKDKHTGLGLSIVHGIVTQSGGAVWVRSAPGEGATFTVALPLAPADAPA